MTDFSNIDLSYFYLNRLKFAKTIGRRYTREQLTIDDFWSIFNLSNPLLKQYYTYDLALLKAWYSQDKITSRILIEKLNEVHPRQRRKLIRVLINYYYETTSLTNLGLENPENYEDFDIVEFTESFRLCTVSLIKELLDCTTISRKDNISHTRAMIFLDSVYPNQKIQYDTKEDNKKYDENP